MKIAPPNIEIGGELSAAATEAVQVLLAEVVDTEADVINIVVNYLSDSDEKIGTFEVSVRRIG